jgi:hypothetical protein
VLLEKKRARLILVNPKKEDEPSTMEIRIDFDSLILNLPQLALDINGLEQFCLEKGLEVGRRLLEAISARMDEALMKARPPGYTIVGSRTKTLATRMGDLRINRRLYRDEHGGYHSLLDEYLGLDKYQRATHGLMREALVHAAQRSYRQSVEELEKQSTASISHETVRRWTVLAGGAAKEMNSRAAETIFRSGVPPEGPKEVPQRLYVEVDGLHLSIRKDKEVKSSEMKVCIWYTGKERRYTGGAGDSRSLTDKYVFGGYLTSDELRERLAYLGEKKVGISRVPEIYWGGDGAPWCWNGSADYPQAVLHLCKYHVEREITRTFGQNQKARVDLQKFLEAADRSGVEEFFRLHLSGTQGKVREKRERLRDYLLRNWEGIEGWRIVCERLGPEGLGAIEGNVDKCAVRRFKDRGCCWSEDGVHALAEVRFSWLNGELDETLRQLQMSGGRVVVEPPERRLRKVVNGSDFWQRGAFPALRVSMERPWQRVLRGITSEVRCP